MLRPESKFLRLPIKHGDASRGVNIASVEMNSLTSRG